MVTTLRSLIDHPALVAAGRLRARLSAGQSYRWAYLDDPAVSATAGERWRVIRDEYLAALVALQVEMSEEDLTRAAERLNEMARVAWLGDWESDWAEPNARYMAAFDALHYEAAVVTLATLDEVLEQAGRRDPNDPHHHPRAPGASVEHCP